MRIERKDPLPLTSTPMVSVIVPAYNEHENIINTVEKLNCLDYPNYEILVINDGSSDESPKLERLLAEKYERVRFINLKENSGKANALYLGYIASKGEYLMCVDGDSYIAPDCLRYMIPHFIIPGNGERVGAVTGNPRVRNRSSLLAKIQIVEYASIISLIKRTQRIWGKVMTVSGVVVCYRKSALADCGLWDRDLITEDIGVTWKLERNFWDIRYEPRAICWMLVPETLRGLAKQRKRWAQGGQEVMFRHANLFKSWRRRRMIPIFLEQVCSLFWVLMWLLLTITEIFKLCYTSESYIPYLWKSQYLSVICILQFAVAMCLEHRYDKKIFRNALVAAWYPLFYWVVTGIVALWALPSSIGKRKKLATWSSPDRGIKTSDEKQKSSYKSDATVGFSVSSKEAKAKASASLNQYKVDDEDIIIGKQVWWKKIIECILTVFTWVYILMYPTYIVYGLITLHKGGVPREVWIYNVGVIYESGRLLYITAIIFLIEVAVLLIWKEYNYFRFAKKNRRTFRPNVTVSDTAEQFNISEAFVENFQNSNIVDLEENIIPEDFKWEDKKKNR